MSESQSSDVTDAARAQDMLLAFLREHEAPCPLCGYNLKSLTRPVCPECGQELVLSVGLARLRLGWLLAALAPCFFSGIASIFVLGLILIHLIVLGSTWPIIVLFGSFGWCSGVFGLFLARKRARFLSLPVAAQRWWAIGIWLTHVFALGLFILIGQYL